MNKLNDDLLNDFVDNNLSASKVSEINKIIQEDENELIKLRSHKFVHQTLKEIHVDDAPHNFTQKVMSKISETVSASYETGYFFKFVIATFVLIITGLLIYSIKVPAETNEKLSFQFRNEIMNKFINSLPSLLGYFNSSSVLIIGSALIIVLFVASFYMMESHINFKKKLEHFSK